MVVKRKKTLIDGIDRDILRMLNGSRRPLSGNQIAKGISLSGSALRPRLNNLKFKGIIKPNEKGLRTFNRKFPGSSKLVKIRSPSSILWGIDLKKSRKKK